MYADRGRGKRAQGREKGDQCYLKRKKEKKFIVIMRAVRDIGEETNTPGSTGWGKSRIRMKTETWEVTLTQGKDLEEKRRRITEGGQFYEDKPGN